MICRKRHWSRRYPQLFDLRTEEVKKLFCLSIDTPGELDLLHHLVCTVVQLLFGGDNAEQVQDECLYRERAEPCQCPANGVQIFTFPKRTGRPEETKEAGATPFEFASSITENSYMSHHSAFEFYGLANQVFSDIYVSTGREFQESEFDGRWYHCIKTQRDFGVSLQKTIRVTDMERTVLGNIKDFDKARGRKNFCAAWR